MPIPPCETHTPLSSFLSFLFSLFPFFFGHFPSHWQLSLWGASLIMDWKRKKKKERKKERKTLGAQIFFLRFLSFHHFPSLSFHPNTLLLIPSYFLFFHLFLSSLLLFSTLFSPYPFSFHPPPSPPLPITTNHRPPLPANNMTIHSSKKKWANFLFTLFYFHFFIFIYFFGLHSNWFGLGPIAYWLLV